VRRIRRGLGKIDLMQYPFFGLAVALAVALAFAPATLRAEPAAGEALAERVGELRDATLPCVDRPTTVTRACVVPQSTILLENGYYQNASKIGSTALAAYPLTRLRVGVAPRIEIVLDAPAQYAESGAGGVGLYPRSQLGFGAKWLFARSPLLQLTLGAEASPPIDRNIPTSTHSRYDADVAAALTLDRLTSLNASLGVVSFAENQHNESAGLRSGIAVRRTVARGTTVIGEITFRSSAANGNAQTSGAIYVQQALNRSALVDIGLGTAFNAAGNAKAHYLGFGVSIRP